MPEQHAEKNGWTIVHDIALVFMAVAYGADHRLSDEEVGALSAAISGWAERFDQPNPQEMAVEALAVYMEEGARDEVVHSIRSLKRTLDKAALSDMLEDIVRIAAADGVLLASERSLISVLSDEWEMKDAGDLLIERTALPHRGSPNWSILHDISMVYLIFAHSTDSELSKPEIETIVARLQDWQPRLSPEEVQEIVREALQFYAGGPEAAALQQSVEAIRDRLPLMQRIALLDDLAEIAEADGSFKDQERELIGVFANAWRVHIRLNGRLHR